MVFENRIAGIEPMTLIDFEGHLACILFYTNCNIRCPYCYNKDVVFGKHEIMDKDYIREFLMKRIGKLDSVVFSGGECTIHKAALKEDILFTKTCGYKIKLDTNGTNPDIVEDLMNDKLLDFVALDFKCQPKSIESFGFDTQKYGNFLKTLVLLIEGSVPFEVRTTVHTDVVDEEQVIYMLEMLNSYGYKGTYYIQFFFPGPETVGSVSNSPRRFNVSKIEEAIDKLNLGFTVRYRNEKYNNKLNA